MRLGRSDSRFGILPPADPAPPDTSRITIIGAPIGQTTRRSLAGKEEGHDAGTKSRCLGEGAAWSVILPRSRRGARPMTADGMGPAPPSRRVRRLPVHREEEPDDDVAPYWGQEAADLVRRVLRRCRDRTDRTVSPTLTVCAWKLAGRLQRETLRGR